MLVEELDSVFEDSPYNPRKTKNSSPAQAIANGASETNGLHFTVKSESPCEASNSDPSLVKKDKEGKIKKWKRRLSGHLRGSVVGSDADSSPVSSSTQTLRPILSLPNIQAKSQTLPHSHTSRQSDRAMAQDLPVPNVKKLSVVDATDDSPFAMCNGKDDDVNVASSSNCNGDMVYRGIVRKARKLSEVTKPSSPFGRLESYRKLEELGEGSYATVYKANSKVTGKFVALKEIRLNSAEGTPFTAIREASLLKGLKHVNIVTLHDIIHIPGNLTFVFEYVETDLCRYMEKHPGPLTPNNVMLLTFQLLRGLAYCHERKILHRDLKPQNLLLNSQGELKLADFGLARAKSVPSRTYSHEVVTVWYRPPDVLLGSNNYSTSLDMWGVGCIFVEMLCGHPLFPGLKGVHDQLTKIFKVLGTPTEETWPGVTSLPEYKNLVLKSYSQKELGFVIPDMVRSIGSEALATVLLQLQPDRRISAHEAMQMPYFASKLPKSVYSIDNCASIYLVPSVQFNR